MEPTRFNVFQRVLRDWDALHPYNAAQILRLKGSADITLLTERWNQTLRTCGIGPVNVRGGRYWIDPPGDASQPLNVPTGLSLEDFMTQEMNLRFPASGGLPFRPFVIQEKGSYLAGIVYHHWLADSASVRAVMQDWFLRCFDPAKARTAPLPIATRGYWHYFGPQAARWKFDQGLASMLSWFSRFRRVRRIESPGVNDFEMRFTLHSFPDGAIRAIHERAKQEKVTVNDLFLAAMATACDKLVPAKHTFRRHDLALGTIVDLRSRTKNGLGDTFGLFLGFTSIFIRPLELNDPKRMLRSIATQTALHKTNGVPEASMLRMAGGLMFHRFFGDKTRNLVEFYRKRFPLCAGISNVNLSHSWVQGYYPSQILEYIRVSPTGPMMPVVFTTTTLGDQLQFGLSTRDSIVSPEQAKELAALFKSLVASPAKIVL